MRRVPLQVIGFFSLVVWVVAVLFFQAADSGAQQNPGPKPKSQAITYPAGVRAITPGGKTTATIVLTPGVPPSVTETDVRAYFATYGFPQTVPGAHPIIEKILFITAKQASELMHGESVGRPDNVLVCYVLLKGPFQIAISGPAIPPGHNASPSSNSSGITRIEEVFDAYSGNMLLWGTADYH